MKYYDNFDNGHRAMLISMFVCAFAAVCSIFFGNAVLFIACLCLILASFCISVFFCIFCGLLFKYRIYTHGRDCIATITQIENETQLYGWSPSMSRLLHIDIYIDDTVQSVTETLVENISRSAGDNVRVRVYKNRFMFI